METLVFNTIEMTFFQAAQRDFRKDTLRVCVCVWGGGGGEKMKGRILEMSDNAHSFLCVRTSNFWIESDCFEIF